MGGSGRGPGRRGCGERVSPDPVPEDDGGTSVPRRRTSRPSTRARSARPPRGGAAPAVDGRALDRCRPTRRRARPPRSRRAARAESLPPQPRPAARRATRGPAWRGRRPRHSGQRSTSATAGHAGERRSRWPPPGRATGGVGLTFQPRTPRRVRPRPWVATQRRPASRPASNASHVGGDPSNVGCPPSIPALQIASTWGQCALTRGTATATVLSDVFRASLTRPSLPVGCPWGSRVRGCDLSAP